MRLFVLDFIVVLLVVMELSAGCGRGEAASAPRAESELVSVPSVATKRPWVCFYVSHNGNRPPEPGQATPPHEELIAAVFGGGRIIRKRNSSSGGAPYEAGTLAAETLSELERQVQSKCSSMLTMPRLSYATPDSDYATMLLKRPERDEWLLAVHWAGNPRDAAEAKFNEAFDAALKAIQMVSIPAAEQTSDAGVQFSDAQLQMWKPRSAGK